LPNALEFRYTLGLAPMRGDSHGLGKVSPGVRKSNAEAVQPWVLGASCAAVCIF
jgi:hypothetical protein